MDYSLTYNSGGKVNGVLSSVGCIPLDPRNTDYQTFLKWNAGKPSDSSKVDPYFVYRPDDVPALDLNSTIPVIPPVVPTMQIFTLPVAAPDFIVQSPKPKTDPAQALAQAVTDSKGGNKSIASIVLNLMVYIQDLEKRVKKIGG